MERHRRHILIAELLLWTALSALPGVRGAELRASAPYLVDVWEAEQGLPGSSVTAIVQTRDGYLWLGTLYGLVRFDGVRFTVFDKSNTPGLESNRILYLFEDSQTNLWVGTETAGVVLVKDGQVIHLGIGQGARERRLVAACEDPRGAVWLYTADGQLWHYDHGTTNAFLVGAESFSWYRTIAAEESGPLWIGTDWRLLAINPAVSTAPGQVPVEQELPVAKLDYLLASRQGGHWRLAGGRVQKWKTTGLEQDWGAYPWARVPVSVACEDRQGNLLVGTQGAGLFWFDAEGRASCLSTNEGLSYNYILSLLVDREGSLWVGTDGGGLNRVKRPVFDVLEESRGWVVQSVCEDEQGGLWIGSNGSGVAYWKEGALERFGPAQGLPNLYVRTVFVDKDQRVLAGTWGASAALHQFQNGQFRRVAGPEAILRGVLAICQDRTGRLWLGTEGGLVRWEGNDWKTFTTRDGLSADVVRAIADDAAGNLWIGTVGGGLNRLREGVFTPCGGDQGLARADISSLYVDEDGVLWMGTDGNGLARLEGERWTRYTTREGLVSNSLGYLVDDGQGHLWIGSNAGLMRVSKKDLNDFAHRPLSFIPCRAYGQRDGLPTPECTLGSQPGACRTGAGELWLPTINGLVSLEPALLQPNPHPPPVMIESVLVDGQASNTNRLRADLPGSVTVPAGKERLEIHYTGLNLSAPDRARFKYWLEGHETDWTEAGNARVARYSKLPPGHYRFRVTACNEDGVWNETGSTLAIIVRPPLWRTWWFLTATAAALLGAIIAVVHYVSTQKLQRQLQRFQQQQALEKERARIARDIHDQLGASLTQVSFLGDLVESDKNSPEDVEAHARQISQTARETTRVLDEIVWAVNPSNDTLDGLITYVCKYAQEYLAVAGLRYRLEVPDQLPNTSIPPDVRHNVFLAAKEAVTNVVRHAQASAVRLRLSLQSHAFTLEIEDNGRGLTGLEDKTAQSRNGLRNMRKRMEDIRGQFQIGPAPQGGTLVGLTVPLGDQ